MDQIVAWLRRFWKALLHVIGLEQGITALEAAIILIAFVVVASVFVFTILSAGSYH